MSKYKIIALYFLFLALTLNSTGQTGLKIQKKRLPARNSTSHIFELPEKKLKDAIVALFRKPIDEPYSDQVFHHYDTSGGLIQPVSVFFDVSLSGNPATYYGYREYFEKRNTDNDILLVSSVPWDSPVYYIKGTALPYITSFALKLKSIDNSHTAVTIKTWGPVVYNDAGIWGDILCNCGIFTHHTTKVKATTIEEHALLLFISEHLGDKTVEPLEMPKTFNP
jgi:hypothetical protein